MSTAYSIICPHMFEFIHLYIHISYPFPHGKALRPARYRSPGSNNQGTKRTGGRAGVGGNKLDTQTQAARDMDAHATPRRLDGAPNFIEPCHVEYSGVAQAIVLTWRFPEFVFRVSLMATHTHTQAKTPQPDRWPFWIQVRAPEGRSIQPYLTELGRSR